MWGSWQPYAQESWPWQGPFLVAGEAGASAWDKRLQCHPHPLGITQQLRFTSMVARFLHKNSQLQIFSLPPLQVVSLQLQSLYRFALQIPHSSLHPPSEPQTLITGWGTQGYDMEISLCPACHRHSPTIAPKGSLLSQVISPPIWGLPRCRNLPFPSATPN